MSIKQAQMIVDLEARVSALADAFAALEKELREIVSPLREVKRPAKLKPTLRDQDPATLNKP